MQNCCLCNNIISKGTNDQLPLYTKFGPLCLNCISKGHFEKIQPIKSKEDFEKYKLLSRGL